MGDECDIQLKLGSFVFDGTNHERKSWKLYGRTFNRPLLVFLCNFSNNVIHCEETTV